MKYLSGILNRFTEVLYLGIVIIGVIPTIEGFTSDQSKNSETDKNTLPNIAIYRGRRIICRDGWIPARSTGHGPGIYFLCLKLYRQPLSWQESQDVCRTDHAFLIKLENNIEVGQNFLDDALANEGIHQVWSGLHVEESKLIWDEMKPNVFEALIGQSQAYGIAKRGWKWKPGTFNDASNTCGLFTTGKKSKPRIVRAANREDEDRTESPTTASTSVTTNDPVIQNTTSGKAEKTDAPTSLSAKMIDIMKEIQDEMGPVKADAGDPSADSPDNDSTLTTESPPVNSTLSTSNEDTTESISKEASNIVSSVSEEYNVTTEENTLYYTSLGNVLNLHKRSTMLQSDPITTITPSELTQITDTHSTTDDRPSNATVRDNSKNITTSSNGATPEFNYSISSPTVTPTPMPTASAPAKGTPSSTSSSGLNTTTITSPSSAELTDLPKTPTEVLDNLDEEDAVTAAAATAPAETAVQPSESLVAAPISVRKPPVLDLSSINDVLQAQKNKIDAIEARMELESCDDSHPFICYSKPIGDLQYDPHCGNGWVSHNHLERCYQVVEEALNRQAAARTCVLLGGKLADVYHPYYGNITAMAFESHPRKSLLGFRAWIEFDEAPENPETTMCDAMLRYNVVKVNCNTKLPSICEKPVPDSELGETKGFEEFLNTPDKMQVLYMTSTKPGTLLCPLRSSSPEDLILWYKDGILIQDLGSVYLGVHSNQFKINNQNRFSSTLKLDMSLFRRLKSSQKTIHLPSMLQGKYWCEVWRRKPFQRIKSMKYLVRYTDVVTLFGTIQTKGINAEEAALFNYMDKQVGIPRSVAEDLLYFDNNITRTIRSARPLLNNIVSRLVNVDNITGRVEFQTYISLSRDVVPESYKSRIFSFYLSNLHAMILANSEVISKHWNVLDDVGKYIFISRTDVCPGKLLEDDDTGLAAHFPTTSVNSTSSSKEKCGGKAAGSARCIGNLEQGAYWHNWEIDVACDEIPDKPSSEEFVDTSDGFTGDEIEVLNGPSIFAPRPTANPGLAQLDEIEIEEDNADDVSDKMAEIMDHAESLTEEDITRIAQVIERINTIPNPTVKVGINLIKTLNKVLETNTDILDDSEAEDRAPTRIISNMEDIANKAEIGKETNIRFVTPNVAMEIWDLGAADIPVIGLGAMVADNWSVPLSDHRIMTIMNRSDIQLKDFDVAIELPEQFIKDKMKERNSTRLAMFIYRKIGLFATNSTDIVVNSPIISASVGGEKIEHLTEKVRMVFRPFQNSPNRSNQTRCVFWNFTMNNNKGGWSSDGCVYGGTLYDKDVCMCDHLTNFAILLDFYGHTQPIDPIHDFTLSIISLIGLSLSIFGLGMTIVTFIFFSKLRQGRAQKTLFHMALSLMGSELVFLIGIKQTDNYYVCLSVAVCLHYFILVSFMWMLVEAILQYLTFVKVLGTYISRYTLKTALPAWGVPLLPVIAVLGIDHNLYKGRDSYCWMDLQAFYYAFALPIGVIIFFNIIMFTIIIISLGRRPRGLRAHQSNNTNSTAKTNLKAALTIFVLLGLTWAFGYMAIADARLVFQYIFTFLSSLQGFFIFILMVARRKQIREQWLAICCKGGSSASKRKYVSSTNSNSTSSNGSNGSGASRRSMHNSKSRNDSIDTIVSNKGFDSLYFIPTSSIPTKNILNK